jgi:uncharacterized protein
VYCRVCSDADGRWKKRHSRPVIADASGSAPSALVRRASDSTLPDYGRSLVHESVCLGIGFGIPAGFLEEIGWTGYAFPQMCRKLTPLNASILLGLLWGLWHLPVIDFLGTATPHGRYLLPYFLAFTGAMTAMRVLISWMYTNTKSILLTQFMHAASTGSLVFFSPPQVNAAQEATWYAAYAGVLWIVVGVVVTIFGKQLIRRST